MNSWKTGSLSGISQHGKSDQAPSEGNIRRVPLTQIAHSIARKFLTASSFTIDATTGNGHDTLFLARHVSGQGKVHGFDVQPQALSATKERLMAERLQDRVVLHSVGHEVMDTVLPPEMEHNTSVIFFNLGYLPGGDKSSTTQRITTLQALDLAWTRYLSFSGILSILVYPGHPAGKIEAEGVRDWLGQLENSYLHSFPSPGPVLYIVHPQNHETLSIMEAMGTS